MKTSKKFKLTTYNCNAHIIITDNISREASKVYKKYNLVEKFEDNMGGMVISLDIDDYYIFLSPKYLTHDTIAHELFHVVMKITEDREVKGEEAQAWLIGHIASETYKFIEKKKLKVSHGR